jgi:rhodanese-related sulfurtransferase
MSILRPDLRRIIVETVYTAGAAVACFVVLYGARTWIQSRSLDGGAAEAKRALAGRPPMMVGKRLAIKGVNLDRYRYSLFVITSPSCQFCIHSVPFHRRLLETSRNGGIPMWIVVPTANSTRRFLSRAGLQDAPAANWLDLSRRFQSVPSVVLVDSNGLIRRIWEGELRSEEESALLAAMRDPSSVTVPRRKLISGEAMLTEADLHAVSSDGTTVINPQEREAFRVEHPDGAVNIPLPELAMRAERDLWKDRLNVLDCSVLPAAVCSIAVDHLRKKGFRAAAVDFGGFGTSQ